MKEENKRGSDAEGSESESDRDGRYVLVPLTILVSTGVVAYGRTALIHIILAVGTVLSIHLAVQLYERSRRVPNMYPPISSPLITGLIVGSIMSPMAPYEMTVMAAAVSVVFFKYMQEIYLGRRYVNPAAAGKVLTLVLASAMFFIEDPRKVGMIFHPHHGRVLLTTEQAVEGAISIFEGATLPLIGTELSAPQSLLLWQTHGWIAGTSGILILILGALTVYLLKLKWRIPAGMLLSLGMIATGASIWHGGIPINRVAFHVFTGSVIFVAFFMATDPETTPRFEGPQLLFGVLLGVLTFVFQMYTVMGGSLIALVILNMFAPKLDGIWR